MPTPPATTIHRARLVALLLLAWTGTAWAVSFDCRLARSRSEVLVCADAELSALDDELAALHARALAASERKADFRRRSDQAWLRRERLCVDKACVRDWYGQRKSELLAELPATGDAARPAAAAASQATPPAPGLAQCVAAKARSGRYTPLDGGRSARTLLVACEAQTQAWVAQCAADGQSRDACAFQVAAIAQGTLKSMQK